MVLMVRTEVARSLCQFAFECRTFDLLHVQLGASHEDSVPTAACPAENLRSVFLICLHPIPPACSGSRDPSQRRISDARHLAPAFGKDRSGPSRAPLRLA